MVDEVAGLDMGTTDNESDNGADSQSAAGGSNDPEYMQPGIMAEQWHLPTELRHKIYGYLMDHQDNQYWPRDYRPWWLWQEPNDTQCAEYKDYGGKARSYTFSRAIMRCNRATKQDVLDVLAKRNQFILVRYCMPLFRKTIVTYDVPVVAHHRLDGCNVHAILIELEWESPPFIRLMGHDGRDLPDPDEGVILILRDDFPRLCEMLRFYCQYSYYLGLYMVSDATTTLHRGDINESRRSVCDALTIKLEVRDPESLKANDLPQMIEIVRSITGGGYALSITVGDYSLSLTERGYSLRIPEGHDYLSFTSALASDPVTIIDFTKALRQSMAPQIKWVHAILWDQLETARVVKQRADVPMAVHQYFAARGRYYSLYDMHRRRTILIEHPWYRYRRIANPTFDTVYRRLHILLYFDICLSIVAIRLRLLDHSDLPACATLERFRELQHEFTPKMRLQFEHMQLMGYLHQNRSSDLYGELLNEAQRYASAVESIGYSDPTISEDVHRVREAIQDAREITKRITYGLSPSTNDHQLRRQQLTSPKISTVWSKMSILQGSLPIFDAEREFGEGIPPAGLEHWVDTRHLAKLSEEEKRHIRSVQMREDLPSEL